MTTLEINSSDLATALKVCGITVSAGSELTSHYVFRAVDGRLEVLSYDGHTFSSCPVANAMVPEDSTFTIEAKRVKHLLDAIGINQVMKVNHGGGETTITSPMGKNIFSSLDAAAFPFWDTLLKDAKPTASVMAESLLNAFTHAKMFVYEQEAKAPHLCVAEFRGGCLYSTDQMAVSIIKVNEMDNATLRVHGPDLPKLIAFLSNAGDGTIEVLESERASFLRRGDGAVFGETVFQHKFPDIHVDWSLEDDRWWELNIKDIQSAVAFLAAGAKWEDDCLQLTQSTTTEVVLSMTSVSGKPLTVPLKLQDSGVRGGGTLSEDPLHFAMSSQYLLRMLKGNTKDNVRLGVSKKGGGGWVRARTDRAKDSYLTTVAWRKSA